MVGLNLQAPPIHKGGAGCQAPSAMSKLLVCRLAPSASVGESCNYNI